jgi:hypothetical protein
MFKLCWDGGGDYASNEFAALEIIRKMAGFGVSVRIYKSYAAGKYVRVRSVWA